MELQPETRSAAWKALQEAEEEPRWPCRRPLPRVTSCFRSHARRIPLLFSFHILTPVPSCVRFSGLRSEPMSPADSGETRASHEPFVLGSFSIILALPARGRSLPRHSLVPSPATSSPAEAAVRETGEEAWRETWPQRSAELPRPGSRKQRPRGVWESTGPAGAAAKGLQTFGERLILAHSPSPHSHCPHVKLHGACRGTAVSRTQWAEMVLNGPLEVPI